VVKVVVVVVVKVVDTISVTSVGMLMLVAVVVVELDSLGFEVGRMLLCTVDCLVVSCDTISLMSSMTLSMILF